MRKPPYRLGKKETWLSSAKDHPAPNGTYQTPGDVPYSCQLINLSVLSHRGFLNHRLHRPAYQAKFNVKNVGDVYGGEVRL